MWLPRSWGWDPAEEDAQAGLRLPPMDTGPTWQSS